MSRKSFPILSISCVFCLATGVVIGLSIKDFPILKLDPAISLIDAASLLVTIAIGIIVPFLLKRWIDDIRQTKAYVVEELREFLHDINEVPELVKQIYFSGKISQDQKNRINTTFETIDVKLTNLIKEFEVFYDSETKPMRDALKECYIEYWKYLTGSELMSTKFKSIDESFYKKATILYLEVESKIKAIIRSMYI